MIFVSEETSVPIFPFVLRGQSHLFPGYKDLTTSTVLILNWKREIQ